jgi:hypothetical protein
MAIAKDVLYWPGMIAASDLTAYQYCVVKHAVTAGQCMVVTAVTSTAIGVLQNTPKSGQEANVAYFGFVKAKAGTSIGFSMGGAVGFSTSGTIVPRKTNIAPPDPAGKIIGYFADLGGTTVTNNQIITILLLPGALSVNN